MDRVTFSTAIFLILLVVALLVAVVVVASRKIAPFSFKQPDVPRFSIDMTLDPYPQTTNVENLYDCNAKNLRVCDIDDATTLFGCKELIVRCHHFEHDTIYVENGTETIIPKNKTPTEGYALVISVITESCNPFHGDLTLVAANADATEYMLVCTCKNPGYIGNETLLGNCTTVFICNGQIDNIDQPLDKIECKCGIRQKSARYEDGLPVCRGLLVKDANEMFDDWSSLVPWVSDRRMPIANFNPTIRGNLKTSTLLDPCRSSLHDTSIEIPNGRFNSWNKECNFTEYGYPVANELFVFKPEKLPDGEDAKKLIGSSAVIATGKYDRIRFSDNISGKRKLYGLVVNGLKVTDEHKDRMLVVQPPDGISFTQNSTIDIASRNEFLSPVCQGSWPSYACYVGNHDTVYINNKSVPTINWCPGTFLWGKEAWNNAEKLVPVSLKTTTLGISMSSKELSSVDPAMAYGVQWTSIESAEKTGMLSFRVRGDFNIHKSAVTN